MSAQLKISDRLRDLLSHRGVVEEDDITTFIAPDYARDIHDPFLLHDMDIAVGRILRALDANEKIVIYADYDADGVPGATVLYDFFTKIGYENFSVYIPHRHDEGFGLHHKALEKFIADGATLLITIDLGITAVDEVAYAKENDLDVIITDHHEAPGVTPDAVAIVNPKLGTYPDPMICGAAVIWKVVCAVLQIMRADKKLAEKYTSTIQEGWEKWLLDMVGIATLSDMVPLVNENRALAYFGLKVLRKSRRPGLQTLLYKLRMQQPYLTEDDITFMVTPKINAASRMAHPMDAFKLLTAGNTEEAKIAVKHLLDLNEKRKQLVAQTMKEVNKKIDTLTDNDVIVIGNPDWQAGILGLVANKIADEYGKPAFVWSREGETIKGSCRSAETCDVVALMDAVSDHLIQFGGHKEAGGFSASTDAIHHLSEHLNSAYPSQAFTQEDADEKTYDLAMQPTDITSRLYNELGMMAPFGIGNPKPILKLDNIALESIRHFGKGQNHLEVSFRSSSRNAIKAIAFFATADTFGLSTDTTPSVTMYGFIEESRFRGTPEIRMRIERLDS